MQVSLSQLKRVIARESIIKETNFNQQKLTKRVDNLILITTGQRYPECRCEDLGLRAGMNMAELTLLGSGCKQAYSCPRLDKLRRLHGV